VSGCFGTEFLRGLGGKLCKLPAMPSNPIPVDDLRPTPAVGIVCIRGEEVLLIRRGTPPKQGEWSIPGGRIEPGEAAKVAALRELEEETSVNAVLVGLLDVVDAVFHNRSGELVTRHYVLIDYAARWISGEPLAGDDAAEARFFHQSELGSLELWSETRRIIQKGFDLLCE
jgi:8-oxo-dGTP diphosphatase